MRRLVTAVVFLCFLAVVNGFGRVINATLSGTVSDPSAAFIPGTEITATHAGTGCFHTVLTNEEAERIASRVFNPEPTRYAHRYLVSNQTFRVTLGTS
jgi:hypothetical protein